MKTELMTEQEIKLEQLKLLQEQIRIVTHYIKHPTNSYKCNMRRVAKMTAIAMHAILLQKKYLKLRHVPGMAKGGMISKQDEYIVKPKTEIK